MLNGIGKKNIYTRIFILYFSEGSPFYLHFPREKNFDHRTITEDLNGNQNHGTKKYVLSNLSSQPSHMNLLLLQSHFFVL